MYIGAALKKLHVVPLNHPIPAGMEDIKREAEAPQESVSSDISPETTTSTSPSSSNSTPTIPLSCNSPAPPATSIPLPAA